MWILLVKKYNTDVIFQSNVRMWAGLTFVLCMSGHSKSVGCKTRLHLNQQCWNFCLLVLFKSHQLLTFGLLKWMTVPSSLIIFTSSMPGILFTEIGTESVRLSLNLDSSVCWPTQHSVQIHRHFRVSGFSKLMTRHWNCTWVPEGGTSSHVTFPFGVEIFYQEAY